MMSTLRNNPPTILAGSKVKQVRDYLLQQCSSAEGITELHLPKSNVLAYDLDDGSRVIVRPSGTEPKIKFYLEARRPLKSADDFQQTQAMVQAHLTELTNSILGYLEQ